MSLTKEEFCRNTIKTSVWSGNGVTAGVKDRKKHDNSEKMDLDSSFIYLVRLVRRSLNLAATIFYKTAVRKLALGNTNNIQKYYSYILSDYPSIVARVYDYIY